MTVYDTFMHAGDPDILEMRLSELEDYEDLHHILVEAPYTHQGEPKPLYYAENKARYARWEQRITHVVASDMPGPDVSLHPWNREYYQRQCVAGGLDKAGCQDSDFVLLCDDDEIPSHKALRSLPPAVCAYKCRLAMFAVDWVCEEETPIYVGGPWGELQRSPLFFLRRNDVRGSMKTVDNGGWHFTWLGGPAGIRDKLAKFCHLELAHMIREGNDLGYWYERGLTWHGCVNYPPHIETDLVHQQAAVIDETWPRYIRERRCPDIWFRPV